MKSNGPPLPGSHDAFPRRYGRVFVAWLIGTLTLPLVALVALFALIAARCEPDSVDCSWGLEFLLVIPVYALCLLTLGPLAVYAALRMKDDLLAARTAWWTLALVPPAVLIIFISGVSAEFLPPFGGRYLAIRGWEKKLRREGDGRPEQVTSHAEWPPKKGP